MINRHPTPILLCALASFALLHSAVAQIAVFDFQEAWTGAKEPDFQTFSEIAPSVDDDEGSVVSLLSNSNLTSGGYRSFVLHDKFAGTSIFPTSATPGTGMNVGGGNAAEATNYFSFTVTPADGGSVSYGSLTLYTSTNAAEDTYNVELRAVDGNGEETVMGDVHEHVPGLESNEPVHFVTFDFDDFTSSNVTEWRVYVYNTIGVNNAVLFDDITLLGVNESMPVITSISVADGILTLTWDSSPDQEYTVRYSTDLSIWPGDLATNVEADGGDETTKDFDLQLFGLEDEERLFVQVESD